MSATVKPISAARRPAPGPEAALRLEHGVLLRQLARLQRELTPVLQRLQQENLRLRAALLVQRTAWLWGLRLPPSAPGRRRSAGGSDAGAAGADWLCQVGCVGHAHPWLQPDGRCQRSGQPCTRLGLESEEAMVRPAS
ncbi:MAG: hypothetical protein ACK4J1_03720 [Hylemonella sp.]